MSGRFEIRPGAEVIGGDDLIGHVGRLVVSPASRQVTALEVNRRLRPALMLPIEAVSTADRDRVETRLSADDIARLPAWRDDAFVAPPEDWPSPTGHPAEHL